MKRSLPIFVMLMCADLLITLWSLREGFAREGNPLGRLYYEFGVWVMVGAKMLAVLITLGICWVLRNYRPARIYVWIACAAMAGVVIYNVFTILPALGG